MIEFKNIEGYYWCADDEAPKIVELSVPGDWRWEASDKLPKDGNYVVAAFFCRYRDGKPHSSIHVRFVDGEYLCDEMEIPVYSEFQSFLGEKGLPRLRFAQIWEEVEKEYDGEIFKTYVPGKSLFAGFVR